MFYFCDYRLPGVATSNIGNSPHSTVLYLFFPGILYLETILFELYSDFGEFGFPSFKNLSHLNQGWGAN